MVKPLEPLEKKIQNGPFGGFFTVAGSTVGMVYGLAMFDTPGLFIGALIGGFAGYAIEHIVFRLLVIALIVIAFLARQALFSAIFGTNTAAVPPAPPPAPIEIVQHISTPEWQRHG